MSEPIITTERLLLRLPLPEDRAFLHAMFAKPEVMADLGPVKDAAASDAALAKHDGYRHEGLGFWVVARRQDGAPIGFCGFKRGAEGTPIEGKVEIGWILDEPYWGQGYAREAMVASLAWAWANIDADEIVAITSARNLKSQGLMQRLGMTRLLDGDFEHPQFAPGDPLRSIVTYAIQRPA